jgi:hypothetical protein
MAVTNLSIRFQLNESDAVRGFCEYLPEKTIPEKKKLHLKHALNTIPIYPSKIE